MKAFPAAAALAFTMAAISPHPLAAPRAAPRAAPAALALRQDRLVLPAPKAGRQRPLVVVVADAGGAETADFMIPFGVLKESGLADVRTLSTAAGPIQLYHAVRIQPDQTLAAFDHAEPEGADIVIVPAQKQPDSPALLAFVRAQAAKGATIVSICEGARVLAAADVLRGKRVTTHWHALPELEKKHPEATWVRNQRYVQDGRIISTTGVSAALPTSLALVEAIGGPAAARATADRLAIRGWDSRHRTSDYRMGTGDYLSVGTTLAAFWTHETVEAPVTDGVDEIALALRTDAWARSLRANVVTTRPGRAAIHSRRGLTILPDAEPTNGERYRLQATDGRAGDQLKVTLAGMTHRYGPGSARFAALTLEADPAETR